MQVKKFEAPTIQEALEVIKRELGPEAIILQTKTHKRGFGLMSKSSVEVTAAISERSLQKKAYVESRIPEPAREGMARMAADRQVEVYDRYADRHLERAAKRTQDRVQVSGKKPAVGAEVAPGPVSSARITATRYIDIDPSQIPEPKAAEAVAPAVRNVVGPQVGKMSMEEELRHLKRMIEELKGAQDVPTPQGAVAGGAFSSPALQDSFEQLILNGMDRRFAFKLVKQVSFELGDEKARDPDQVLDQLACEIMNSTETLGCLSGIEPRNGNGPVVIALIGPTGVGKTTTVAKMASEALLRRNLKVGLINLDCYKVAASDQLETYSKILNVPFRSASGVEDLRAAIGDFHTLDVVIVDTTGRSQRDPNSLKEMEELLKKIPSLQTQLVLSATTRDTELYDMANRFSSFRPQGIIVSKLDEAAIYGALYNVSQKTKLPLLYFTTGQRVPEDIEEASRERVAALIMGL